MAGFHIDRISEDIKREIVSIMRELKDPRISDMLTVVKVDVSGDLSYAKVYISAIDGIESAKKSVKGLESAQGYIRKQLGTRLHLRKSPELKFIADDSIEKGMDLFEKIKETIAEGGISDMIEMVENHVNDEDYTSMDMAAALLKMVIGDSLDRDDDVEEVHFDMYEDDNRMVRLFINVGKKDKIKPANILGAIAGESGMPGKLVGAIDMLDNYTFVEVPAKHADKVLKAMSNAKIKGRSINIEKAQGGRKKKGRRK